MSKRYKAEETITKIDILAAKVTSLIIRSTAETLLTRPVPDRITLKILDNLRGSTTELLLQAQTDIFEHISDKLSKSQLLEVGYRDPALSETYLEPHSLAMWMDGELNKWSNL